MSQDPVHRKLAYLAALASEDGIALSMDRWLAILKQTQSEISYDVIWRLLQQLYLWLNLGIDWTDFDFPPITPPVIPPPILPPIPDPPIIPDPPPITKCILYGVVYDKTTLAPLSSGTISISGTASLSVSITSGYYVTPQLDPGVYVLAASSPGYQSVTQTAMLQGGDSIRLDFPLKRTDLPTNKGEILGSVYNRQTQVRIQGGYIYVTGPSSFTVSIVNGAYSTGQIDPGTYTMRADVQGYDSLTLTVTVAEGEYAALDFPMTEQGYNDLVKKLVYDETNWDLCYYDPPGPTLTDIDRFAWQHRKRVAEKDTVEYKKQSLALKTLIQSDKDSLLNAGVSEHWVDATEEITAMVESRILRSFCVGFAVVGISRVAEAHPEGVPYRAPVDTRAFQDWISLVHSESVISWEAIVGYARVSQFRVGKYSMLLTKEISDEAVRRINAFWQRVGLVPGGELSSYGGYGYQAFGYPGYQGYLTQAYETLYQRLFMLQRVDQYHYAGGAHQVRLQTIIKRVKQICDKEGVIGVHRRAYTSFAQEIYYLTYDSHRLWKTWKRHVTIEDIINKYINIGCDTTVLNRVRSAIVP